VEGFFTETVPEAAEGVGGALHDAWDDFASDLSDVSRPLAGAALIIVADLPVAIGESLCALTAWSGVTCVAVNLYAIFVATPATYVGLCMMAEDNFFKIPGLDSVCGSDNGGSDNAGKE
jgi:hypothetical protein